MTVFRLQTYHRRIGDDRYQILIMFLIATDTGFAIVAAAALGARPLFDDRERLRLDRLRQPEN